MKNYTSAGFSLVELMVGMLVGLIGTMVIFQIFSVAEGQKRTTTAGGDAAQSAAFALFSLERDLRMAGQGFNNKGLVGCSIRVYDSEPTPRTRLQGLVPAVITPGVGNIPDTLSISYSDSEIVNPPSALVAPAAGTGVINVDNRGFYQVGDVAVLSNLDNGEVKLVAGVPHQCTMFRITGTPVGSNQLLHAPAPGNYTNGSGTFPIRINHPAGLDNGLTPALTFPTAIQDTGGFVFHMGKSLVAATYSVNANRQLVRRDDISDEVVEIADGVVQMRALYGIDANADNQISTNEWTNVSPTTPLGWQRLRAVKLALVSRSALREKDCTATAPVWYGASASGGNITLDVSADTNWQCYKYKVFQTIVPLRNMGWIPYR